MAKKKQEQEKEELYYVAIKDPMDMRKNLLQSSRLTIQALKRYEHFKELRKNKIKYMFELRRIMEELMILNRKLKQALPKTQIKIGDVVVEEKKIRSGGKVVEEELVVEEKNRMKLLEEELAKIESKLDALE